MSSREEKEPLEAGLVSCEEMIARVLDVFGWRRVTEKDNYTAWAFCGSI